MLNISFYLLTPKAKSQSIVYVSISNQNLGRLRFPTNLKFLTSCCNSRTGVHRDLVKKNTEMYFQYSTALKNAEITLVKIYFEFENTQKPFSLEQIKNEYYKRIDKIPKETEKNINQIYELFIKENCNNWTYGTLKSFKVISNHLAKYQKKYHKIELESINLSFWKKIRDDYFVNEMKFNNSTTNKYLKKIKQFILFGIKEKYLPNTIDVDSFEYLDTLESFKIALKENELETLSNFDLSQNKRLESVRDLFLLEVLTGQRFSDLEKVLDKNNVSETEIRIYQQKTNELVSIPIHPKLKKHLLTISEKYPNGLPIISNQKFNDYLKEVCKLVGCFDSSHSWVTMSGRTKTTQTDFRYNLISSHTGRRTFCTLSLMQGIKHELIMKVSGHRSYEQFKDYVKVDDTDVQKAFQQF